MLNSRNFFYSRGIQKVALYVLTLFFVSVFAFNLFGFNTAEASVGVYKCFGGVCQYVNCDPKNNSTCVDECYGVGSCSAADPEPDPGNTTINCPKGTIKKCSVGSGTTECWCETDGDDDDDPIYTQTLKVNKGGTGVGTVTSNPTGISCGTSCTTTTTSRTVEGGGGTTWTLTASTSSPSTFAGWSVAQYQYCTNSDKNGCNSYANTCGSLSTCRVLVSSGQTRTVTANFNNNNPQRTLTVGKNITAGGTVTSSPSGINCGSTCSRVFANNTSVTLTATPATGYTFTGWAGAGTTNSSNRRVVTMDANRTVTANFTTATNSLTVSKTGTGTGTLTSNPTGINCGSTCSKVFNYGTVVSITPTDGTGIFRGWSGACSGTGSCSVTMNLARSVTARFDRPVLTVNRNPAAGGTVTGAGAYNKNATATVTATASPGFAFSGWSGACTGAGTCRPVMSDNRSVTARFETVAPIINSFGPLTSPVEYGGSTRLAWATEHASSCVGGGFNTGGAANSSVGIGPLTSRGNYTITCSGPGGSVVGNTTVEVYARRPTITLKADPTWVRAGDNVTIEWSISNATSCNLTENGSTVSGVNPLQGGGVGSYEDGPINQVTTYRIDCRNTGPDLVESTNYAEVRVNILPIYGEF